MKLDAAMRTAAVCGLKTLGEAFDNIIIHSLSLFKYEDIGDEISELLKECRELGDDSVWQEMPIPAYIVKEEEEKMNKHFAACADSQHEEPEQIVLIK